MTDKERLEEIMDEIAYVRDEYLDDKAVSEYYGRDIISEIVSCPISALSCIGDYIELLQKRVQELEDIIYQDARQGMIEDLYEENKRYRETIKSVRSEIKYALYSNKSEDVKRHYLQNAEREATEALEEESE